MKKDNLFWIVSWVSVVLAFGIFLIFGFLGGFHMAAGGGPFGLIIYYAQEFGISLLDCVDQLILFAFLFVVGLASYAMVRQLLSIAFPELVSGLPLNPLKAVFSTGKKIGWVLWDFLPVMMLLLTLSLLFSEANALDRYRLVDLSVIGSEHFLTGTYVFAWLGSFHWPHAIIVFIIGCFWNVATIVILPTLCVGYITPRVFREMLTAFALGMTVLGICWLFFPALSPQDRFIDNVYKLPVPRDIAVAVANYHPQPEIQAFLDKIRAGKNGLGALPTTTIPSAHVFWIGLAAYYFFRSKKWLGWIILPFLVASAMGTVLLAQHYLLDVITSLVVVGLSIWAAKMLEKKMGIRSS